MTPAVTSVWVVCFGLEAALASRGAVFWPAAARPASALASPQRASAPWA